MKKVVLTILAVAALVAVMPAKAGSGEIGADFGRTNFDSSITSESGTEYAVRGGWHFTKLFELEGQYGDSSASDDVIGDITMNSMMVNAVFNFHPTNWAVPYCLGGVGQAKLAVDTPFGNVDDTGSAYQFAVGSRFLFGATKKAGLRVELSSMSEDSFDETSTHTNFNVGFTWQLGS
jgi:opacity protein-like surface antigen